MEEVLTTSRVKKWSRDLDLSRNIGEGGGRTDLVVVPDTKMAGGL